MSELRDAISGGLSLDIGEGLNAPPRKGRPKGSRNKPKIDIEPEEVRTPYVRNETNIAAWRVLSKTLWNVSRRFTKWGELSKEEIDALAEACDPLAHKYMPFMDKWQEEANFVIVLLGIISAHANDAKKEVPTNDTPTMETDLSAAASIGDLVRVE